MMTVPAIFADFAAAGYTGLTSLVLAGALIAATPAWAVFEF